jgi:hypothetical protein
MATPRTARSVIDACQRRVRVDARGLAALRIALGALIVADLALRSRDLVAFYTDAGVVPRATLSAVAPTFGSLSLHALWGSPLVQALLFAVAVVVAASLLVGYRTRLATVASLVLLVSLHARNPVVLNGGDSLLRHLLLWGSLLPLGREPVRRDREPRASVASVATAGLLVQVVAVYATNAVLKFRGERWLDGTAVEQVMALTRFSTPLGRALVDLPAVAPLLDYLWLGLLVASPLLALAAGRLRGVLAAALGLGHLGMALFIEIGLFPLISVAGLLPFLPSPVWDRVPVPQSARLESARRAFARRSRSGRLIGWLARRRALLRGIAAVLLAAMVVVNLASVGAVSYPEGTPDAVRDKGWDMFAPDPPTDDGWYVAVATLESGRQVDALRRPPLAWDRPSDVSATLPNHRWKKLLYQVRSGPEAAVRAPLAAFLCERWNRTRDDGMVTLRLVYVPDDTRTGTRGKAVDLGQYACD